MSEIIVITSVNLTFKLSAETKTAPILDPPNAPEGIHFAMPLK
jgi:hypothetical protein